MMSEREWTDNRLIEGAALEHAGLMIRRAVTEAACLISGNLAKGLEACSPISQMVGLYQLRRAHDGIRIARDRALLVGVAGPEGWHDGYACSPATGLYTRFDLSGPALDDALAEGTSADLADGSPSAAVLFAGLTCLLTRNETGAELWVETAFTTYMTTWFARRQ
uniref:Uncharacterized protein n=2 Tax=Gymnodinialimonas phycosphaerae TaxID=2841589 RepID=A0A975YG62_9RHOB